MTTGMKGGLRDLSALKELFRIFKQNEPLFLLSTEENLTKKGFLSSITSCLLQSTLKTHLDSTGIYLAKSEVLKALKQFILLKT